MSVTESLLRVFRVDQQLRGLTGRLTAAEKFLAEQSKLVDQLNAKRHALESQQKQLQVQVMEHEGQIKSFDERIEKLKGQMDTAQTNKEYKALLTELNTYKADRSTVETAALQQMGKVDEVKKQLADLAAQLADREKVRKVAEGDRKAKADEIADRLSQLKAEREALFAKVPAKEQAVYTDLVRRMGDEAMAPVSELDRRNHEYTCGSCQMAVPVEKVTLLMRPDSTQLVLCASCRCILYIEAETAEMFGKKGGGKRKGKKDSEQEQEV